MGKIYEKRRYKYKICCIHLNYKRLTNNNQGVIRMSYGNTPKDQEPYNPICSWCEVPYNECNCYRYQKFSERLDEIQELKKLYGNKNA